MLLQLEIVVAHNDVCFHYLFYISSDGMFDEARYLCLTNEFKLTWQGLFIYPKKTPAKDNT